MHTTFYLPIVGLVGLVLYKLFTYLNTKRLDAAFARKHNCQPAPMAPGGGFLGMKLIKRLQQADREGHFMDVLMERYAEVSAQVGFQCNTFQYNIFGSKLFFTVDPKNIQAVLAHRFEDFDLGRLRNTVLASTLGYGIFTQDGKQWEHSRAMIRPNFVRDQVSDLEMTERHIQDLFTVMPAQKDGWTGYINIQELFFRMTIDSATEFLFGESTHTQLKAAKEETSGVAQGKRSERAFAQHFDSAQRHMSQKFRLGEMHWMHNPKEYQNDVSIVNEFVEYYVNLALKKGAGKQSSDRTRGDKYVFLDELATQTTDPVALRAQLLNVLLAGRDTTSSLLSWVFHELLRHPEVFTKLRAAVLDSFGPDNDGDTSRITFASLKNCTYLQHTLSEALRLWPVVPGNSRRSNKRTWLPRGGGPDGSAPVFVPADTQVDYSVHVMMRRKDLWGEDANTFRPERFEGRKAGWEFLPFNGGPRICIGQQFALTEASYVVARLLQRFDKIEAPPGTDLYSGRVPQNLTLTSCPKNPVTLRGHLAR